MSRLDAMVKSTTRPINHILHVGDIAYAVGNSAVWAEFMEQIAPIASAVPWMVAPGNHDTLCTGADKSACPFNPPWPLYLKCGGAGGECGVPYDRLFFMPGANGSASNRYYSFDHGPVHVAVISSEEDLTAGSPQYAFLDADLSASRARAPGAWRIVLIHRPFYGSTIVAAAPERVFMRRALEPLLLRHAVDACLSGHLHQYQRSTCRIAHGKCDAARGVWYASIGTAGPDNQVPFLPLESKWVQSKEHGVVRFDVLNASHMRATFVRSADGATIDEFDVVKAREQASAD